MGLAIIAASPKETVKVVRQRSFDARSVQDVIEILASLAEGRHTGSIRIDMGQGSIQRVCAEDATPISA